jgi:hypothetical protein
MDYKINENCVLVLKCNDERNSLDVAVQEVEDIYGVYLKEYKTEFSRNENHVYTIDDFENIIYFFNKVDSNILAKTNKFNKQYAVKLDEAWGNNFAYIDYLKEYIDLVTKNPEISKIEIFNAICTAINKNYNPEINFSEYIKGFIEHCYYSLEILCKISNLNHQTEKNKEDSTILFTSYRKKGFKKDNLIKVGEDLIINIDTNFAYGKDSYFVITVLYKNIEIISTALFKEISTFNYYYNFKPDNSEWSNALDIVKNIANVYIQDTEYFNNELIIKDFNERLSFCENLIDNETVEINNQRLFPKKINLNTERLLFKSYKISHLYSIYKTFIKSDKTILTKDWETRVEKLVEKLKGKLNAELEIINDELVEKEIFEKNIENKLDLLHYSLNNSNLKFDSKKISEYLEEFNS